MKTLLTKRNLFSDKRLNIKHGLQKIPQKMLEYYISEPYKLIIKSDGKILTIMYEADKFSLSDLRNIQLEDGYSGGNGKRILTKEVGYISYKYEEGWNIYELDSGRTDMEVLCKEYEIKGRVSHIFMNMVIMNKELSKVTNDIREKWDSVISELLQNILYNTNLIDRYYEIQNTDLVIYDENLNEVDRFKSILAFKQERGSTYTANEGKKITLEDIKNIINFEKLKYIPFKKVLNIENVKFSEEETKEIKEFGNMYGVEINIVGGNNGCRKN